VAARPRGALRHSIARVVRAGVVVVAVPRVDAAVLDALPAAGSCLIACVELGARVTVITAVPRLRSVRAPVDRMTQLILGARVAVLATDWRAVLRRKTPRPFTIAIVVHRAYIVVAAEEITDRVARTRDITMREVRR